MPGRKEKTAKTLSDFPDFDWAPLKVRFNYQPRLTKRLDAREGPFDPAAINEIVLWKVNRYAELEPGDLELLNLIDPEATRIDAALTSEILQRLLSRAGIRLPMASTILRFRNPNIYQIIDQRAYRALYGHSLPRTGHNPGVKAVRAQIALYLRYLRALRSAAQDRGFPFSDGDRILYQADRKWNEELRIRS